MIFNFHPDTFPKKIGSAVTEEVYTKLNEVAKANNCGMSEVIRVFIEGALGEYEAQDHINKDVVATQQITDDVVRLEETITEKSKKPLKYKTRLSDDIKKEIIRLKLNGVKIIKIAEKFNISTTTVKNIYYKRDIEQDIVPYQEKIKIKRQREEEVFQNGIAKIKERDAAKEALSDMKASGLDIVSDDIVDTDDEDLKVSDFT